MPRRLSYPGSGVPRPADGQEWVVGDAIRLRGLRVMAIVGVLPEERDREQPLECDLDIEVDLTAAGVSDALDDTVNYAEITDAAVATMTSSGAQLLERMSAEVAEAILQLDGRIEAVAINLAKLNPPVPHDLATSAVRITRRSAEHGATASEPPQ